MRARVPLIILLLATVAHAASETYGEGRLISSASELDYPPFSLVSSNGEAAGFSVELLRATLGAMDRQVRFKVGPWNEIKQDLAQGRIEVLPLVGRTPEREAVYDFSFPYLTMHGAIFIRDDNTDIRSVADLVGKEIVVMRGDNAEEFVRREQLSDTIVTTDDFSQALRLVSSGQHDAVVVQLLVGLNLVRQLGIRNLRPVAYPIDGFRQDFCFAVREGNKELLALLNEGLSVVIADGTLARLQHHWLGHGKAALHERRLIIGGDLDYPPYEYLDDEGKPTGYNVELTTALAEVMGLEVEIRLGRWNDVREQLTAGTIDAVQGMFYSEERDKIFDFSPPHTVIHHAVFCRRSDGHTVRTLLELRGSTLIVMRGDIMHDLVLEQGLSADPRLVDTQDEALRLLQAGRGDHALIAKLPGVYWIRKSGYSGLKACDIPLPAQEYCYAVRRGDAELLAVLSEGLAVLKQQGIYKRIWNRWLGVYEQKPVPWSTILSYSLWIVAPLMAIAAGAVLWSWSLRRQVSARTTDLRSEVAQRARVEERLRESLSDKETLLRELHHRTKNNMQVISGLLSLQSSRVADPDIRSQLDDTQLRIRAMALVHEKLYRSDTLAEVDFKGYVDELAEGLISSFSVGSGRIACRLSTEPIRLSIERAVPCGLILNELIGNCLKHAFPDGREGFVEVRLQRSDGSTFELAVRDNGIGLAVDAAGQPISGSSMGLVLVRELVEKQLGGTLELHRLEPGTEVLVQLREQ